MYLLNVSKVIFKLCLYSSISFVASNSVRLVGLPFSGRLEVSNNGRWGTVCSNNFDMIDATVVCRELNLGYAVKVLPSTDIQQASKSRRIVLDSVECDGDERRLSDCLASSQVSQNCTHSDDVGVECTGEIYPIRFASYNHMWKNTGYIEIQNSDGLWGTVCYHNWTSKNTDIACKQLGFIRGQASGTYQFNTILSGVIFSDVNCVGDEQALSQCPNQNWKRNTCWYKTKVSCFSEPDDCPSDDQCSKSKSLSPYVGKSIAVFGLGVVCSCFYSCVKIKRGDDKNATTAISLANQSLQEHQSFQEPQPGEQKPEYLPQPGITPPEYLPETGITPPEYLPQPGITSLEYPPQPGIPTPEYLPQPEITPPEYPPQPAQPWVLQGYQAGGPPQSEYPPSQSTFCPQHDQGYPPNLAEHGAYPVQSSDLPQVDPPPYESVV